MCDEYDDERMRAFWRAISDAKRLRVIDEADLVDVRGILVSPEALARNARPARLTH